MSRYKPILLSFTTSILQNLLNVTIKFVDDKKTLQSKGLGLKRRDKWVKIRSIRSKTFVCQTCWILIVTYSGLLSFSQDADNFQGVRFLGQFSGKDVSEPRFMLGSVLMLQIRLYLMPLLIGC